MNTLKILFAEIRYRKLNFLLSLIAVMIAVILFVAGPMLIAGYQRTVQAEMAGMKKNVEDAETGVTQIEENLVKTNRYTKERLGQIEKQTETQLAKMEKQAETKLGTMEKQTQTELDSMEKQTRRLMLIMGFNLMIVHRDTNMSDFWAEDFATENMPEEYVARLANDKRLDLVTHIVATLQERITVDGRKVLLVGYLPESTQPHREGPDKKKKPPMGYRPEKGTVYLGYEVGIGKKKGDTINILGKDFEIARILHEQGSKEDITVIMHLADTQEILDKPGRINQILALGCHCAEAELLTIREQLAEVLPDTRITEFRSIALARTEQRNLMEQKQKKIMEDMRVQQAKIMVDFKTQQTKIIGDFETQQTIIVAAQESNLEQSRKILEERQLRLGEAETKRANAQRLIDTIGDVVTPLVVLACVIWVGLLALMNVRERRTEIGVLRAIGKGSSMIATLFLGKAILVGLLGAGIGLLLGIGIAQLLGTQALQLEQLPINRDTVLYALIGAPLLSAVASYLPTHFALAQDPAVVLRDQ